MRSVSCNGWRNVWRRDGAYGRPISGGRVAWAWARRWVVLLLASAAVGGCASAGAGGAEAAADGSEGRLIVAVRHAEKVDDSRDPALSPAGEARAVALAEALADLGIDRVLSSDYIRTRDTATPTAEAAGVDLELYDPRDIPALAAMLRAAPEDAILVVGHSNTTPALVAALSGQPTDPMPDDEYDRLYRVWIAADGTTRVEVDRLKVDG